MSLCEVTEQPRSMADPCRMVNIQCVKRFEVRVTLACAAFFRRANTLRGRDDESPRERKKS